MLIDCFKSGIGPKSPLLKIIHIGFVFVTSELISLKLQINGVKAKIMILVDFQPNKFRFTL